MWPEAGGAWQASGLRVCLQALVSAQAHCWPGVARAAPLCRAPETLKSRPQIQRLAGVTPWGDAIERRHQVPCMRQPHVSPKCHMACPSVRSHVTERHACDRVIKGGAMRARPCVRVTVRTESCRYRPAGERDRNEEKPRLPPQHTNVQAHGEKPQAPLLQKQEDFS